MDGHVDSGSEKAQTKDHPGEEELVERLFSHVLLLYVEVSYEESILLDELPTWFYFITHQGGE